MSFAEPILLAGFILVPLAILAYGSLQRRRRAGLGGVGQPRARAGPDDARAPAGGATSRRAPAARAVRVDLRAGAAAAHRRRAAAGGEHRDGHRHLGLYERDRRPAGPPGGRGLRRQDAHHKVPPTFRLGLITFSDFAEQRVAPTTDRGQIRGALDQLVAEGGTAMGDGLERGLFAARTPVPNADGSGVRRCHR